MTNIDLSTYNLSELKGLQHEIEQEIKSRQHRDLQKAREQILAIAQQAGVSLQELAKGEGKQKSGKGVKVQARYQNPADSTQTWTGRGRQPRWISEAVAGGKILDDLRI